MRRALQFNACYTSCLKLCFPKRFVLLFTVIIGLFSCTNRQVPIQNYAVDTNGQVRITVNSDSNTYYILRVRHHPDSVFRTVASITPGKEGTTTLTEPLAAYPVDHYEVLECPVLRPQDSDGDGLNDLEEYRMRPLQSPLNAAKPLDPRHAFLALPTRSTFDSLCTTGKGTQGADASAHLKFLILDFYSDHPRIYFLNSATYKLHLEFTDYLGVKLLEPDVIKGQLVRNSSAGQPDTYAFSYANNEGQAFGIVQRTQELLAANMPFLTNNLLYLVTRNNEAFYFKTSSMYRNSRVRVVLESCWYAGINYHGIHPGEGYGVLRSLSPGKLPGPRDIVLADIPPGSLPRVAGIISSAMQSPLSHLSIRAVHDNIPFAFVRNAPAVNAISQLCNHYVYFKADQNSYQIREATLAEVNAWFEKSRPHRTQHPRLNLSYRSILPLDAINFNMYDGFGAKTANLAAMRTFGFSKGTVPDGYGIPFYFYNAFMLYNNFFAQVRRMLNDKHFSTDRSFRSAQLKKLRAAIRAAKMPTWMLDELAKLQRAFPNGTAIRCRSSTNNEDLPGFSGAGLYDSKTHHPNEGHLSKTIRQVYASLWNLRAFEEREFYRVDHFTTAMGVLCHSNFEQEKVNGVAISADPVYQTDSTFYINSQFGERLVTQADNMLPEEVLLHQPSQAERENGNLYTVIQRSQAATSDSLLLNVQQLKQLRDDLTVIHNRFSVLYRATGNPTFAMDIEFKIDRHGKLVVKQARPWVAYRP